MNKELTITKILLEDTNNNGVRVYSNIKSDKEDYKLWFEVDKKYEKYVLTERADAFLVAVLPYAIKKELDIVSEEKISSKLYYQLTTYFIPMLCKHLKKRVIEIHSNLDNNRYNTENAVGTGMSGGIDSFYTVFKHTNLKEKEFNITHLTFFNVGASGNFGGEKSRNVYLNRMNFPKKFAEENNFKFVSVDSNLSEFLMMHHLYTHTLRSSSCALLLQKLFSKYYYSSAGYDFDETKIEGNDIARFDILTLKCISTEDIEFYSTGMETNRIGKIKEVAEYKPSYDILSVCINEDYNCGVCSKCRRTLLELDAIGKLENYKNVFNLDYYYKHKTQYLIYLLKEKRRKEDHLWIYLYNEYTKNKKIPLYIRLLSYIPNKDDITFLAFKIFSRDKLREKFGKISDGWY